VKSPERVSCGMCVLHHRGASTVPVTEALAVLKAALCIWMPLKILAHVKRMMCIAAVGAGVLGVTASGKPHGVFPSSFRRLKDEDVSTTISSTRLRRLRPADVTWTHQLRRPRDVCV
jgi:hypothetical protein